MFKYTKLILLLLPLLLYSYYYCIGLTTAQLNVSMKRDALRSVPPIQSIQWRIQLWADRAAAPSPPIDQN